jgi:hypothetical protein
MLKLLCKLFDHNWNYYKSSIDSPSKEFRCCPNCGQLQHYRAIPGFTSSSRKEWISLTQRTKKGGKEFAASLENATSITLTKFPNPCKEIFLPTEN